MAGADADGEEVAAGEVGAEQPAMNVSATQSGTSKDAAPEGEGRLLRTMACPPAAHA